MMHEIPKMEKVDLFEKDKDTDIAFERSFV